MTDDEIIKLLKEIDMCTHAYSNGMHIATTYDITKMRLFAKRVAAAESEACAKVCEARKIIDPEYEYDRHYNQAAEHCAFAIRARGET